MRLAAGLVAVVTGLGFGVPGVVGLRHFARTGEVWTFLGFPTYRGAAFERVGMRTSTPLLLAFVVVCASEIVLGAMLIAGAPGATQLHYALLPFEFVFWIGFVLPSGPPLGLARIVLVALST